MNCDPAEILSHLNTELKQLQATFRHRDLTPEQKIIGRKYEKLLENGIAHFSSKPRSRITSCSGESDDNIMSKISGAQNELLLKLMPAQLMKKKKKTKRKKKKKTKKRKKTKRIIRK